MQSCVIYTFEEKGKKRKERKLEGEGGVREKPICAEQDSAVIISGCYYCGEADV